MDMPLEVELLVAAWDNVKKNLLVGDDYTLDPDTGDMLVGHDLPDHLGDLVADLEDKMCDLISYYREHADADESFAEADF